MSKDVLRVAMYTSYPLTSEPSGVGNYIRESVSHLEDKGCKVRVIAPDAKDSDVIVDYTLGKPWAIPRVVGNMLGTHFEGGMSFRKRPARRILEVFRPDIVNGHEIWNGTGMHNLVHRAPKRRDGTPVPVFVATHHANPSARQQYFIENAVPFVKMVRKPEFKNLRLSPGAYNTLMSAMEGRIAISKTTAEFAESMYAGVLGGDYTNARCRIIPNGIDTKLFIPASPEHPAIPDWENGKKTLLYAGRHDKRKGMFYLLEAYRLLRKQRGDIQLKITGSGKLTGELLAQIIQNRNEYPDVEFLGNLSIDELAAAYRSADLFLTLATDGEGFGRTIPEAVASGSLVVATNIPGYREAARNNKAVRLVPPKNPHAVADAVQELFLLPDTEKQDRLRQGRDHVIEHFSWPKVAEQLVIYYEELLSIHGRSKPDAWKKR